MKIIHLNHDHTLSRAHASLRRAFLITSALLLGSNTALAQVQGSNERDIIERVPNVIKKSDPYGFEMMIEGDAIVERTSCQPTYPQSSLRNGESGIVTLQLMINTSGFVTRAKIAKTSGFRELDRASMISFLGCKFKPVLKDGIPVDSWIVASYTWTLK